jgi:hypothetical protein
MSTNGTVKARAFQADGGNIAITAGHFLTLRHSTILGEAGGGPAVVGANIALRSQFIVLQNSQIFADAFAGRGGKVLIDASRLFLADPMSTVSSSSILGVRGEVSLEVLPKKPFEVTFAKVLELSRTRCVARLREGTVSRFVIGGRDGVPLEPGSLLLSPLVREEQPGPAPLAEPVAGQREASFGPGGGLERPNTDSRYLRGTQAPAPRRETLDMDCARWRGMQGTDVKTVP